MEVGDSFYNEHLSDYSDDFEEDEPDLKSNQPPPLEFQSTSTPRHTKPRDSSFIDRANKTDPVYRKAQSHYVSGTRSNKLNRSSIKGKGRAASEMKAVSRTTKQSGMFSPRDRELSAKRHTIKKLESSLTETKRELEDMKKENRLLNRLQVRQEKTINRFQTQEGELPEILARHAEEVRALKEQLKRSQEASQSHQRKATNLHQELLRVNNRKKRLEEVAKRKHLLEREKLTLQLQDTNEQLQGKERRIAELERGIEAMNKNHGQEVRSLMLKNKALSNEAEDLRNASQKLHAHIKEKEREMDVLNIYSQRLGKNMPPRIATRLHAPMTDSNASQTELTCPPSRNVSLQTKLPLRSSGSQTDFPSPKPPTRTLSVVATQTDVVVNSKNETLEVSSAPQASSNEPQQPISKPIEVETKVKAKTDVPKLMAHSPPKASGMAASVSGGKTMNVDVEEQKKRELLATLRAMDAQKDPPGSQPMVSSVVKSTAQPTSNVTVGGERRIEKMTKQSSQVPPPSQKPAEDDEDKAQKKKLLLAKLMAIDEGGDPNKVTASKMDVSKPQPQAKQSTSGHQSTSSIQSWPDTVENMYNGKPAFATDEDPFGSRHSSGKKVTSTKSKEFFLTEGGGDSPKSKRLGRRRQLEQKKSNTDISLDGKVVPQVHEQDSTQVHGYQPTFGRRAGASNAASQKPKNGMIFGDLDNLEPAPMAKKTKPPSSLPFNFESGASNYKGGDYPWETRVNVSSNPLAAGGERPTEGSKMDGGPLSSPSMVFGYVGQQKTQVHSGSKGSLLPLREKAGANVMPGSIEIDIAEPDDLEELAL